MPGVCGKIKVLVVASAGHALIPRGCGPNLTVGATRSEEFLTPRCGWGNRELSIETAPGGSEVARIKLHSKNDLERLPLLTYMSLPY